VQELVHWENAKRNEIKYIQSLVKALNIPGIPDSCKKIVPQRGANTSEDPVPEGLALCFWDL